MDKVLSEKKFLCVEANYLLNFVEKIKSKEDKSPILILNQSYGLVSIAPIRNKLHKSNFEIQTTKIGSTECHNTPNFLKPEIYNGFEHYLFETQPSFLIVDGTRNIGGISSANHKYPDSQQGFLNYAIVLDDAISQGKYSDYSDLLKVSYKHVKELRKNSLYNSLRDVFEQHLENLTFQPDLYGFEYWNPAGLELNLYNAYKTSRTKVPCINLDNYNSEKKHPHFIFVNSSIPNDKMPLKYKMLGTHDPAYFDDKDAYSAPHPIFTKNGYEVESKFDNEVQNLYSKMFDTKE